MIINEIVEGLRTGNRRALAKAITLVESRKPEDRVLALNLLEQIPSNKNAIRLGISGPPGVGKSSFIEIFGLYLINKGHKLAVLAIDPSSSLSQGSILGDKTRMQDLSCHSDAFIRPSPGGDTLGGVALRTREAMLLCEAAGYDWIIIETIGVGQSEIMVQSMVDLFVPLQQPYMGDDLQGMKKGILELADVILINKADGENLKAARKTERDLHANLRMGNIPIICCSAHEKTGINEFYELITDMLKARKNNGTFDLTRKNQATQWFHQGLKSELLHRMFTVQGMTQLVNRYERDVESLSRSPFHAIRTILNQVEITIRES